jgi:hypothetical protein
VKIWAHYYLLFVTEKVPAGLIAGRYIYKVKQTSLIPIVPVNKKNKITSDELRYKSYFQSVDLTEDFYFSYSYDITNTFQNNCVSRKEAPLFNLNDSGEMIPESKSESNSKRRNSSDDEKIPYNEKFLWNFYLSSVRLFPDNIQIDSFRFRCF